jgi:hypothetical protein
MARGDRDPDSLSAGVDRDGHLQIAIAHPDKTSSIGRITVHRQFLEAGRTSWAAELVSDDAFSDRRGVDVGLVVDPDGRAHVVWATSLQGAALRYATRFAG